MKFVNCLMNTSWRKSGSEVTKMGIWPSYILFKEDSRLNYGSFHSTDLPLDYLPVCLSIDFSPIAQLVWVSLISDNINKSLPRDDQSKPFFISLTFLVISVRLPLMKLTLGVGIPRRLKNLWAYHILLLTIHKTPQRQNQIESSCENLWESYPQ